MAAIDELEPRSARGAAVTRVTSDTLDAMGRLAEKYIELARIEVRDELEATLKRGLWVAAGWLLAMIAVVLLVAGFFLLAGDLIDSAGVRLILLAVVVGIAAFALVLHEGTMARKARGDTDRSNANANTSR
jgi:hypothetical protein